MNRTTPFTILRAAACGLQVRRPAGRCISLLLLGLVLGGCGTTKSNTATEQMVNSDAVDMAVAKIDFTPLNGQLIYFDTSYISDYKGVGFVNSAYVISSLRQQMLAAGLLLQEKREEADYIVEARLGTLGIDNHEVVYGIPSNSAVSAGVAAASVYSGVPSPGSIPELSLARRNSQVGAAKIGVFAYDLKSREAVWQSGISVGRSQAKDMWVFGVGPFQKGSFYQGNVRFAGAPSSAELKAREGLNGPIAAYRDEMVFQAPRATAQAEEDADKVQQAGNDSDDVGSRVLPASGTERPEPASSKP